MACPDLCTNQTSSSGMLLWPYSNPLSIKPFWFEKDFEFNGSRKLLFDYFSIASLIGISYVIIIHVVQWQMRDRKPFNLRMPLAYWNFFMALFSTVAFLRMSQELFQILSEKDGMHRSLCIRDTLNPSSAFWLFGFLASKVGEFVDTAFIILRKRPLNFIHWYHHVVTYLLTYFLIYQGEPIGRYYAIINLFVHSFMYTYFGLAAIGYKLPYSAAFLLTSLQILQFIVACGLNFYTISAKLNAIPCEISNETLALSSAAYVSYIVLFVNLFVKKYFPKKVKGV